jgi:hypothetical protein
MLKFKKGTFMKIIIFFLLSQMAFADLQKCVDNYNASLIERNNAIAQFKIAQNQKREADGKIEKWQRKKFIQAAKESAIAAIDFLAKSDSLLNQVKAECVQSVVDKANEIIAKNASDLTTYEEFKKDMDLTLQLPK